MSRRRSPAGSRPATTIPGARPRLEPTGPGEACATYPGPDASPAAAGGFFAPSIGIYGAVNRGGGMLWEHSRGGSGARRAAVDGNAPSPGPLDTNIMP